MVAFQPVLDGPGWGRKNHGNAIMPFDDFARIRALFDEARALPPERRPVFLAERCERNEDLRQRVEALLAASAQATDFLESSEANLPAQLLAAGDDEARVDPLLVGTRIGPYRIAREIGRGGMGRVYLAERVDGDFDQRVAIKFVGGFPTKALLSRFRDERRILAALGHPNIARLIDGGATADGHPYVIMEYVDGVPIDEFCEAHTLGLKARVELFLRVCDAVQYAHQRLVIHRDLKGGNILVTTDGTPKLLDFGIAKLLDDNLASAERTRTLFRVMTPETASPEQIRGEPVTTATDVYALGVLLYRLLTGQSPYGATPPSGTALLRAVCDQTPPSPSAVQRRAGVASIEATHRDLDSIVLKALRKEPDRRYRSVQQFADDLQRFLGGLPVLAVPDSRRYRAGKFLRRHRIAVGAAAVAGLAVLAAAGVAVQQARAAAAQRARAEERLADVRRLANSFLFEFHDAIANLPGTLAARQLVVKRAAEHLDGLARDTGDDVTLLRELATANMRLGDILGGGGISNLGDLDGAGSRYATALAIRTRLASRANPDTADIEGLAQLHIQLSRFSVNRNDLEGGEQHARTAITVAQALATSSDALMTAKRLATAHHQLGFVQARRGKTAEALASFEFARQRAQQAVDSAVTDPVQEERLVRVHIDYADQLVQANRPLEAIRLIETARPRLDRLLGTDPMNNRYKADLIYAFNMEAAARGRAGDHPGAIAAGGRALALAEQALAAEPRDAGMHVAVLLTRTALGVLLLRAGDAANGVERLREAISTGQQILAANPQHGFVKHQVTSAQLELAEALLADDRQRAEGCRLLREGLTIWRDAAAARRLPNDAAAAVPRYEALLARC